MLQSFLLTQGTSTGMYRNMQCSLSTCFILPGVEIPIPTVGILLLLGTKTKSHKHLPLYILPTCFNGCLKPWPNATHFSNAELANLSPLRSFAVVELFSPLLFQTITYSHRWLAWHFHHSINMSRSLGNNGKERNTSWECERAARSMVWRIIVGSACMKHEATGASLQSVKFRSCLSSRQGDINLKRVQNYRGRGKKEHLGFTAFLRPCWDEYYILLPTSPADYSSARRVLGVRRKWF